MSTVLWFIYTWSHGWSSTIIAMQITSQHNFTNRNLVILRFPKCKRHSSPDNVSPKYDDGAVYVMALLTWAVKCNDYFWPVNYVRTMVFLMRQNYNIYNASCGLICAITICRRRREAWHSVVIQSNKFRQIAIAHDDPLSPHIISLWRPL